MRILYQARERDLPYEQILLEKFSPVSVLEHRPYLNLYEVNAEFPEKEESLLLYEKVIPHVDRPTTRTVVTPYFQYGVGAFQKQTNLYYGSSSWEHLPADYDNMTFPKVACVCVTDCNHGALDFSLNSFLEQDYAGNHRLYIINTRDYRAELTRMYLRPGKRVSLELKYGPRGLQEPWSSELELHQYLLERLRADILIWWEDVGYYDHSYIRRKVEALKKPNTFVSVDKFHQRLRNNRLYLAEKDNRGTYAVNLNWLKTHGITTSIFDTVDNYLGTEISLVNPEPLVVRNYDVSDATRNGKGCYIVPTPLVIA